MKMLSKCYETAIKKQLVENASLTYILPQPRDCNSTKRFQAVVFFGSGFAAKVKLRTSMIKAAINGKITMRSKNGP